MGGHALYKFNEKAAEWQVFEKKKLCWGITVYIRTRVEFVWWTSRKSCICWLEVSLNCRNAMGLMSRLGKTELVFMLWCCSLRWRRVNALKFLKDQTSFFSSSSSRPWFLGFQCHSRFKSALTGLQHISISPLSLHRLPLMSPWSSGMLTGTSMLTSLSLSAGNILLPNTREQTFSFSPSWFTIDQRLCCTAELPNSCIRY